MILIDLFNQIKFDDIWKYIANKHPVFLSSSFTVLEQKDKEIILKNSYLDIKNCFKKIQKQKCFLDDNIFIVIVKEEDPDKKDCTRIASYLVEKIDVLEKKENISIWGDSDNEVKRYGYNFISWEEILGYTICPESLNQLSAEEIVCEIFCEMTRFGFSEEKIRKIGNNISEELEGLKLQEELEKSRKKNQKDSWFDNFCDKIGISKRPKEYYGEASEKRIIVKKNHLIHIDYIKSIINVHDNID